MKHLTKLGTLCAVYFATTAQAGIAISSMIEFTDNSVGYFTITNVEEYRQFINVQARELIVNEQGEIEEIPYTRSNLDQWSLSVRPARAIVEPAGKKEFRISYEALERHNDSEDKAYQLSFIPTPYFGESSDNNSAVQVAVGFAPSVIVPASEDQPLNYSVEHHGSSMSIINHGKTYIRTFVNACPSGTEKSKRDECQKMFYVLSGRKMNVTLPNTMQTEIEVTLSTHRSKFKENFDLEVGATKQAVTHHD